MSNDKLKNRIERMNAAKLPAPAVIIPDAPASDQVVASPEAAAIAKGEAILKNAIDTAVAGVQPPAVVGVPVSDAPKVDYLCGLRCEGRGQYRLVSAVIQGDDVIRYESDTVAQPLQFSAETLRLALRKLLGEIP